MNNKIQALLDDNNGTLPTYAWPGAYPLVYVTRENADLCPTCAQMAIDEKLTEDPQWEIVDAFPHYEGADIICEHCGKSIESAYGDPDAE